MSPRKDVVADALDDLFSGKSSWFPANADNYETWVRDTWSAQGLPQVLVFTGFYFVLVVGLIVTMERNTKLKVGTRNFAVAHNLAMSIFSGWMFVGAAAQFWRNWNRYHGWERSLTWCDTKNRLRTDMEHYYYFFFVSKFLEYIDSVLLIMNRKYSLSVGFSLQVYHHATTASIAWVAYWGEVPSGYIGLLSNCLVHVVMYLYFALVSIDRDLRIYGHWVTKLQLTQFWIAVGSSAYWYVHWGNECWSTGSAYIIVMYLSYLIFFLVFNHARQAAMRQRHAKAQSTKSMLAGFRPPCVQTDGATDPSSKKQQ